jgi:hypothetical protein
MPERGGVHHERRAVTRLDGPHNEEKDAMPLSLVLRKLISPVEVKLVLSAFSEEMRRLEKGPQASLGSSLGADLVASQVREDVFRWADQIKRDVHEGKPPRVVALYLTMNVARDYLASGRFHVYRGRLSMGGKVLMS